MTAARRPREEAHQDLCVTHYIIDWSLADRVRFIASEFGSPGTREHTVYFLENGKREIHFTVPKRHVARVKRLIRKVFADEGETCFTLR